MLRRFFRVFRSWRVLDDLPTGFLLHAKTFNAGTTRFPNEDTDQAANYAIPVNAKCATVALATTITVTGGDSLAGATIVSDGTAVVVADATESVIEVTTAGTLWNAVITLADTTTVVTFPLSEGAGDTVYGYDADGVVYTGAVTTADLTAFWAATQDEYFHGVMHGYSTRENLIPNSACVGADDDPSTAPTAWQLYDGNGLTYSIVAHGTNYIDVKVAGTTTKSTSVQIRPSIGGVIPAVQNDPVTFSFNVEMVAGNASLYFNEVRLIEQNSSAGTITTRAQEVDLTQEEIVQTWTVASATAAFVQPFLSFWVSGTGTEVDFTIRVSNFQLTKTATQLVYTSTVGAAVTGQLLGNPHVTGKDVSGNTITVPAGYNNSASYQVVGAAIAAALADGGGGLGRYYEQYVLTGYLSVDSTWMTVTESGGWYTAVLKTSNSAAMSLTQAFSFNPAVNATFRVSVKALSTSSTQRCAFAFYNGSSKVTTVTKISGPGTVTDSTTRADITDLDETTPTVIEVKLAAADFVTGSTIRAYFYPVSTVAANNAAGDGCIFSVPHVFYEPDDTDRAYIAPTTTVQLAPDSGQESTAGASALFDDLGASKTLTYAQMLALGVGPQVFMDAGGRGVAIYEEDQTGTTLDAITRYMRTVRDPVVAPDPDPDPEPSDDTYFVTDHTAGLAEFGLLDTQSSSGWTMAATKTDNTTHFTHEVTLTSITSATRAATLRYRIPVSRTGLSWLQANPRYTAAVNTTSTYQNSISSGWQSHLGPNMQAQPMHLWAGVVNSTTGYGLLVDPFTPVNFQTYYNAATQELCVIFFLGFHTDKRTATVKFHDWSFSSTNGTRQLLNDIHNTIAPSAYDDRLQARGVGHWSPASKHWETNATTVPTPIDFNLKYNISGSTTRNNRAISAGFELSRYQRPTEAFMVDMGSYTRPYTHAEVANRVSVLSASGNAEALAIKNAGCYDVDGNYIWHEGDPVNLCRCLVNPNPDITPVPNQWSNWGGPELDIGALAGGHTATATMVDNAESWFWTNAKNTDKTRMNYRADHFGQMTTNLTHDKNYRVCIHYEIQNWEWYNGIREKIVDIATTEDRDVFFWTNGVTKFTKFITPQVDAIGGEIIWFIDHGVVSPPTEDTIIKHRIQSGKRIYLHLFAPYSYDYMTNSLFEKALARCVCWGMLPCMLWDLGTFTGVPRPGIRYYFNEPTIYEAHRPLWKKYMPHIRAVSEAGWEPLRNFTLSDSTIWGERYGHIAGTNKTVYITVFNPSTTTNRTFTLSSPTYSNPAPATFTELISNQSRSWTSGNLSITLGPEVAQVFRLTYA